MLSSRGFYFTLGETNAQRSMAPNDVRHLQAIKISARTGASTWPIYMLSDRSMGLLNKWPPRSADADEE